MHIDASSDKIFESVEKIAIKMMIKQTIILFDSGGKNNTISKSISKNFPFVFLFPLFDF